jgi:hypothetical protein
LVRSLQDIHGRTLPKNWSDDLLAIANKFDLNYVSLKSGKLSDKMGKTS